MLAPQLPTPVSIISTSHDVNSPFVPERYDEIDIEKASRFIPEILLQVATNTQVNTIVNTTAHQRKIEFAPMHLYKLLTISHINTHMDNTSLTKVLKFNFVNMLIPQIKW